MTSKRLNKAKLWQILEKQESQGWGSKVIDQLSRDLKSDFPDIKGFSARNLKYMRRFALEYPDSEFVQQVAAQLPWFHLVVLIDKIKCDHLFIIWKFLLELGAGFAFVGRQYHLDVGDEDFYLDLLFYHLKLRCYVVVELKADKFKPEHAGKMNFYLSAVDDLLRHPSDNPSIGLILCKTKNEVLAEYALRDMTKAIGLSNV